ncbi:MAG: DUF4440 domain-containing protein [Acidobacteria bacterium]|nr:DUF4440 domain-containing protein [Acidobacteriota bacterium]
MIRFAGLVLAAGLSTAAAAPAQEREPPPVLPSITLPAELDRVLRAYEREWGARSPQGLATLFTEDGFVLQPGRPPVRGHEAIARAYQGSGGPLALRALAYATADTVGYIVGAYATAPGDPDVGKFILLLRRRPQGPWLIAADMDNGNRGR